MFAAIVVERLIGQLLLSKAVEDAAVIQSEPDPITNAVFVGVNLSYVSRPEGKAETRQTQSERIGG
ncbi:MAG: hypothetical protein KJS95_13285, partial [Gammaproteobacteria bacterium]|nr:hypothetical protein [Gammaproteobacteria bacterium]